MVGTALDAREVLLLPSDVEHLVAVPAAQRGQSLAERYALPAIGADAVFGHPGKARRLLGARPQVRRSDAPVVADACHNNTARGGRCLGTSGVSPTGPPGRRSGGSPSHRSRSVFRPWRVLGRGAAHVTAPSPTAVASPPCRG